MGTLKIPGDISITFPGSTEDVTNGYHSFAEINTHRCLMFIALMLTHPNLSWKTVEKNENDKYISWLIGGMNLPSGIITMHIPKVLFPLLDNPKIAIHDNTIPLVDIPPKEVAKKLHQWILMLNDKEPQVEINLDSTKEA